MHLANALLSKNYNTMTDKKEYLIYKLSDNMKSCIKIDAELFRKLDVKRGLRNEDGTGVLVGLTNIGNVVGYKRTEMPRLH